MIVARTAHADDDDDDGRFGAHAAYAIGGEVVGTSRGLRQHLDVGGLVRVWERSSTSSSSPGDPTPGVYLGASALFGFGKYPTYVAPELAWGFPDYYGTSAVIAGGPALRVSPSLGYGGAVRSALGFSKLEIGAQLIVIGGATPELQLSLTLGFGRL